MTMPVTEYVVVLDERIPEDRLILEGINVSEAPTFTVSEVAKFFFGRSSHWVRWREKNGIFVFEGQRVGNKRTDSDIRIYTLDDVEKMAHALAEQGHITATELSNILRLVLTEARVWGYIEDEDLTQVG